MSAAIVSCAMCGEPSQPGGVACADCEEYCLDFVGPWSPADRLRLAPTPDPEDEALVDRLAAATLERHATRPMVPR